MAPYIDSDKLWNNRPQYPTDRDESYIAGFSDCMWEFSKCIQKQIRSDIPPKTKPVEYILFLIDEKIRFEVGLYNGLHSLRNGKTLCQERVNALNDLKLIINHQFSAELKNAPTADVAPKSEVAREIFAEIEKIIQKYYDSAQNNEEDEELEAATDYLSYVSCDIDDLKEKYGVNKG